MWFLKEFTESDLTTCAGKPFHTLTILLVKKYLKLLWTVLALLIFSPFERVLSWELISKSVLVVTGSYKPLQILYVSMRSPLQTSELKTG